MKHRKSFVPTLVAVTGLVFGWSASAWSQQQRDWRVRLPVGASLTAGIAGLVVDQAGVTYVTGISGSSSNTDITTAAYGPDGSLRWMRTFDGPASWHDQARGLALAPSGILYVVGNTPGPDSYAQVLLLAYNVRNGRLLRTVQYSSGPMASEHGASVAVDGAGNVYVAGGTTGDGGDALVLAYGPSGKLLWQRTWDGPAFAPYSQDTALEVLIGSDGNPIVLIHGVMATLHPDYVVLKYGAGDGSTIWETSWGVAGEDSPRDLELDAAGDVYVTGTGLHLRDEFATIKLDGETGALLWQAYDQGGLDDHAAAVAVDDKGGVYITGSVDPDGDHSNFNDNIMTVRREAADGSLAWTRPYGANCIGCYDIPADVKAAAGNVYVVGRSNSQPYTSDALVFVLDGQTGEETARHVLPSGTVENAKPRALRIAADSTLRYGGDFYNANTGQVDMSVARITPAPAASAAMER
jgi:PQQ-like domain